jgi:hypothetical protein
MYPARLTSIPIVEPTEAQFSNFEKCILTHPEICAAKKKFGAVLIRPPQSWVSLVCGGCSEDTWGQMKVTPLEQQALRENYIAKVGTAPHHETKCMKKVLGSLVLVCSLVNSSKTM